MHIENLRFFYMVGKAKSISKIASEVHISQSALSQQIQKLENNLGFNLLSRSNKGVELTEKGQIVFKYADHIVRTYTKMQSDLNSHESIIRIEATYPVATYALPCTLYRMKKKFPKHKYELISNSSENIIQNILNDICDIGFVNGSTNIESIQSLYVGSDKIVLVAEANTNIPAQIDMKDLLNHTLIMLNNRFEIRKTIASKLKEIGYTCNDLNIIFNLDSLEAIKASISKGYGLAFLPYMSIKKELYTKQFKSVKIAGFDPVNEIHLMNKNNQYFSGSLVNFVNYFKTVGKEGFC
ncbi:MAG: LysR family transcriptional regulator [Clostridiales bacterium]|nr:LysR family transcriptional regulator [Clostridiales bacterium]